MSANQSVELTQFYQGYLEWLAEGCPTHSHYSSKSGLCENLRQYCIKLLTKEHAGPLLKELGQQLAEASLSRHLPFNKTCDEFGKEIGAKTCSSNSARIVWVITHT